MSAGWAFVCGLLIGALLMYLATDIAQDPYDIEPDDRPPADYTHKDTSP